MFPFSYIKIFSINTLMEKTLKIIPDDVQRIIFRFISHKCADIIKNINYIKEFYRHKIKSRKYHLNQTINGNVFGHYDCETYKLKERNNEFWTFEYNLKNKTMNSFGLCESLKTKNELIKYCFLNGIVEKTKRFNVNWSKKKIIHCILKADI